jgi:ABC-type phosphate/phosphonate transport system substrate-binding protein
MYAVAPEAEAHWQALIGRVADEAGVALAYEPYPAPQPLEHLWRRADVGAVQMCGYPIALGIAPVLPLAAPVPAAEWAKGRAVYRSDLIVRADSPYGTLADTFGGTAGWTVEHSHSGFNAFRHHLLRYRSAEQPTLYGKVVGGLVTARRVIDAVLDGTIDVGPLDAYWHMLIRRYRPELTAGIRVLESTDVAPMPAFVAAPGMSAGDVDRLRQALVGAHGRPWFETFRRELLVERFEAVDLASYAPTLAWDREAKAAGYAYPA